MKKSKKKILLVQNMILPYRVPIYNLLNQDFELTVAYSLGQAPEMEVDFKMVKLPVFKISRFVIHKNSLFDYSKNFDVVIGMSDISWLSIMGLSFRKKRKFKTILWGIGVRASYDTKFGEITFWDKVRHFLTRKADALLFYSSYPLKRYLKNGFKENKLFVANNTVMVNSDFKTVPKKHILFIGTLYKQKNIYALLNSYLEAFLYNKNLPQLILIGDGDEYQNILEWIEQNQLTNKIFLKGKIFDEKILSSYFSGALACISPGQAGLSVLKSMGYGVPFITQRSAITGGEILNIKDGVNGVLFDDDIELKNIILDIADNKNKFIQMGKEAKTYYDLCRKPTDMVKGMASAINYVLSNN
ncbi:glycosyltransferase [Maribacter luteus]|uniref:glycosyltransferase n=1 Tax=Maribacter luteus TaxID=2594478 RepID=UPI00249202ED|nr:glycosyltransferase [Maribacter luteus]